MLLYNFQDSSCCRRETLYPFSCSSLFPLSAPATIILFCPYKSDYFRFHIWVESWRVFPSVTGLFYLAHGLKVHPCYNIWQDFLLFQDWNFIVCIYCITFPGTIHLLMHIYVFSASWLLGSMTQWTWDCKCICKILFSTLLNK